MNIIFMGTPEFAVPSLKKIAASRHQVLCVVTPPDRPAGRGQVPQPPPVKLCAQELGFPVWQPVTLTDQSFYDRLKEKNPDLIVVVAFRILPVSIIKLPSRGCVNLHASLLPKYRGAAPLQWAIINGDTTTGLTTFFIEEKVDTGNILLQRPVDILPNETSGELALRMQVLGADLLLETIDQIESHGLSGTSQKLLPGSPAPKLEKENGQIKWHEPADKIRNLIRGLNPKPGAFTWWDHKVLKIHQADVLPVNGHQAEPGTIIKVDSRSFVVACGKNNLAITALQLEGKKKLNAEEFLRGVPLHEGQKLGV